MALIPRLICAVLLSASSSVPAAAVNIGGETRHTVFLENTDYELHVYRIRGELPGKTLMIVGGIHNEPGGYLTADLYVDMALRQGNLIVVPRANFPGVVSNQRIIQGDMNRQFGPKPAIGGSFTDEEKVVEILKDLMRESDLLLNLHDGSGFFRPTWISGLKNPSRWGQSIIADDEQFLSPRDGNKISLKERAARVLERVNAQIPDPEHRFHFNDTRTGYADSPHPEMRGSATYFGLTQAGVESYGIETSKEIQPIALKVKYQCLVINAFMEELDILPQNPKINLDPPILSYLLVSVNEATPYAIPNGRTVFVRNGDRIRIEHISANYERGLTANIVGLGGFNDLHKSFAVTRPLTLQVKKDQFPCGEVYVTPRENAPSEPESGTARVLEFLLQVDGKPVRVANGASLTLDRSNILKIINVTSEGTPAEEIKLNFLGFVPRGGTNSGEDRNYPISAVSLLPRYSKHKKGKEYFVVATRKQRELGRITIQYRP
jgi:hypothetical protein